VAAGVFREGKSGNCRAISFHNLRAKALRAKA
jgi:hypothetical protein